MPRLSIVAALLTAGIMRSQAEPLYTFRAIAPCPGCGALVSGINDTGEIAGSVNNAQAFYGAQGHYTIFAEPGAFLTEAIGITNSGRVTVNYLTPAGTGSEYILAPNGSKTVLPQVGNVTLGGNANDTGLAVGFYGADFSGAGGVRAYVDRDGALDYTFQYPGALVTQALNVNDAGVIVGEWKASLAAMPHGYVRSTDGTMTTLDVPGSIGTEIFDINNAGDFAGNFWDASGRQHGFMNQDGVYTMVDYTGPNTTVFGMNDLDQLVGASYADGQFFTGPYSGFVATPVPEPRTSGMLTIGVALLICGYPSVRRRTLK